VPETHLADFVVRTFVQRVVSATRTALLHA
jgi:hypothetical protein